VFADDDEKSLDEVLVVDHPMLNWSLGDPFVGKAEAEGVALHARLVTLLVGTGEAEK